MDLLNLRALLTLDKSAYEQGLNEASGEATGFGSKFKGAMGTAAKAGAAALAASATAVSVLGKNSINAYADTQQLVGGVQKLYGNMGQSVEDYAKSVGKSVSEVNSEWKRNEEAQNIVLENAKNAFKTAGISANQYMEQATSFSAALINSLGGDTKKAAEQTDVAMRAIADNYNTFGGDMEMIQYAFQGFAKQNYTMLDNLKLGYGGTKTEMQRLIDDANKWAEENGKAADLSIDSFSDVVTAIDYIQQKQNIAGTTAREASTTISGSIGMVKAAWENLMAGMADPDADISKLIQNLMKSIGTAGKNIMPAIQQFAKGLSQAIVEIAPMVIKGAPKVLNDTLPMLIGSAIQLIDVVVQTIVQSLPKFINAAMQIIMALANGLVQALPELIPAVVDVIIKIALALINNINLLVDAAMRLAFAIMLGLIKAIPELVKAIPQIVKALITTLFELSPEFWKAGGALLLEIGRGIVSKATSLKSTVRNVITGVKNVITNIFASAKNSVLGIFDGIKSGIRNRLDALKNIVKNIIDKIKGFFHFDFELPHIKLPHFVISPKGWKLSDLLHGSIPSLDIDWYKKAYDQPYLFTKPTVVGGRGFGDGVGGEIVYGRNNLLRDIRDAVKQNSLDGAVINLKVELDGKVVGQTVTPIVNTGLFNQSRLDRRNA